MNSTRDEIKVIRPSEYPELLRQIDDLPPEMYLRGRLPPPGMKLLTIVGTRHNTEYGKKACKELVAALRGLPVAIVSGLAYGIDSIAHEAALENGLMTIAVPGSSIEDGEIYPAAHLNLARRILDAGGGLFTPFKATVLGNRWTFPFRNRIMAGMSDATLVIESTLKSGTYITAAHATNFGRNVCAVPGSIFSPASAGPHQIIRSGGIPIACADDLLEALGFEKQAPRIDADAQDLSEEERVALAHLVLPRSRDELVELLGLGAAKANTVISMLELRGLVEESLGEIRRV